MCESLAVVAKGRKGCGAENVSTLQCRVSLRAQQFEVWPGLIGLGLDVKAGLSAESHRGDCFLKLNKLRGIFIPLGFFPPNYVEIICLL